MQKRIIISCGHRINQAQWICVNHKLSTCENCRKNHTNCKAFTIDQFEKKISELIQQRSYQIDEVQKLQDKMRSLLKSPQGQIVQELLNFMEDFNYNETFQNNLIEKIRQSLEEFKLQKTKEKLKELLGFIELERGNINLQNDFTDYYLSLKQKLTEYMDGIQDIFNQIKEIIQQQQYDNDTESISPSSDSIENQQIDENKIDESQIYETEIKSPQNIINYETAIAYLLRERDSEPDPTQLYQEDYQKIKFLLEIRENYVIAASNLKVFLIQLYPPVVRSILSFRQEKITSISKFQNQEQYKFIIAQKNGEICIINSDNDRLQLLKHEIVCDQPGRLLIGLSENILVTVGGNHRIRYYLPDKGMFYGSKTARGRNFIKRPPKCLLVLNDDINFIAVAGAQDLFIIRNQIKLQNLHAVDQKNYVKFLGYSKKNTQDNQNYEFLFAATHKKVYIYDLKNHNLKRYLLFPNKISYFQVINNRCLINCRAEAEVNGFRAYQIQIREIQQMQPQHLGEYANRNIVLAKLQEINQSFFFQIFIADNLAVRREAINI